MPYKSGFATIVLDSIRTRTKISEAHVSSTAGLLPNLRENLRPFIYSITALARKFRLSTLSPKAPEGHLASSFFIPNSDESTAAPERKCTALTRNLTVLERKNCRTETKISRTRTKLSPHFRGIVSSMNTNTFSFLIRKTRTYVSKYILKKYYYYKGAFQPYQHENLIFKGELCKKH